MAAGLLAAFTRAACDGAIAQLGERVVRNDEVGGSIPPGSTTLRPSGFAWRSRAMPEERSVPGIARRATTGGYKNHLSFDHSGYAWRSRAVPEGRLSGAKRSCGTSTSSEASIFLTR